MELGFLKALVLIFGFSALAVFILHKLKVPPLVGFIAAGVLIGPHGLGFIENTHEIEVLAEIGVILLLFTIGIEFSLKKLLRIKNVVLYAGGGQVILAILFAGVAAHWLFGSRPQEATFIGFLVALSSTAIVLRSLAERGETDSPQGHMMMGVLIFQDLCVVPLMLLTPMLAGAGTDASDLLSAGLKAVALLVGVLAAARWVVPQVLHHVVHTKSRELFLLTVILTCLGTALLTSSFGLSLALGAFLAGLVISESEYSLQAMVEVLPFKDGFLGLFFVSIGMLLNVSYLIANLPLVLGVVLLIVVMKTVSAALPLYAVSSSLRSSMHAAFGLAQIGEFSFILAETGREHGLIGDSMFQLFLSSSVLTMTITPFMVHWAAPLSIWMAKHPLLSRIAARSAPEQASIPSRLSGHVIIVGFGLGGRNIAYALKESDVPYVALEMNSTTVRRERERGHPIYFGDGVSPETLHKMGLATAGVLVVAISDAAATRKVVATARKENHDIHIIVRTHYVSEVDDLLGLGANEVIPEEFETSVEIFARVLDRYNVPRNIIDAHIDDIRRSGYLALRSQGLPHKSVVDRSDIKAAINTSSYMVKEGSGLEGKTLKDVALRTKTGATVIAIERDGQILQNPSPDLEFMRMDIIHLMGRRDEICAAMDYLGRSSVNPFC